MISPTGMSPIENAVAGGERGLAELGVEHAQRRGGLVARFVDLGVVLLLRRRADQAPEQRMDRRRADREHPVHPLAGAGALLRVRGLQRAGAVLGGEIAHDRVRFPQHEAVVLLERRHQRVRIHRQVERLLGAAERAADVDALVREVELADRPHHLLHVDGRVPPPDLQHCCLLARVMAGRRRGASIILQKDRCPGQARASTI